MQTLENATQTAPAGPIDVAFQIMAGEIIGMQPAEEDDSVVWTLPPLMVSVKITRKTAAMIYGFLAHELHPTVETTEWMRERGLLHVK